MCVRSWPVARAPGGVSGPAHFQLVPHPAPSYFSPATPAKEQSRCWIWGQTQQRPHGFRSRGLQVALQCQGNLWLGSYCRAPMHLPDNGRGAGGVQMMIMAMAVDPSGRFVVAGGLGGCLARLWSLASLQVMSTLMPVVRHPTSSITGCGSGGAAAAAPPSNNVASAAPSSNAPFGSAPSRGGGALSACWLGNDKVLLGTDTGEIKVWCSFHLRWL